MKTVALVTGANQGLGLALVRRLCRALGEDAVVCLAARDPDRGRRAASALEGEGLNPALLSLDVADDASVAACAATVAERHGGLDVLVSNAAARISPDRPDHDQVAEFINVNNLGTTRVLRAFAPLLRPQARVVVVASSFGSLRRLAPPLRPLFDGPSQTLETLDATMRGYAAAVEDGRAAGWPEWINIPSKVGQVASMRVFARLMAADPRQVAVTAACPGLVDTEASRPWFSDMSGAQTPDEAAVDVVWQAMETTVSSGHHGELLQHRQVIPWR